MPRQGNTNKSKAEIDIENQIKALDERLAIERSKRLNQTIKRPAKELPKIELKDEIPKEIEEGEPEFEEISVKLKNNYRNVILEYKVKNYVSNNVNRYLDNISKWLKKKHLMNGKINSESLNYKLNLNFYFIIQLQENMKRFIDIRKQK